MSKKTITSRAVAEEFARTGKHVRLTDEQAREFLWHEDMPMEATRNTDGVAITARELTSVSVEVFAEWCLVTPRTVREWIKEQGLEQLKDGTIPFERGEV